MEQYDAYMTKYMSREFVCVKINIIYVYLKFHCSTVASVNSVVVSAKFTIYTHTQCISTSIRVK